MFSMSRTRWWWWWWCIQRNSYETMLWLHLFTILSVVTLPLRCNILAPPAAVSTTYPLCELGVYNQAAPRWNLINSDVAPQPASESGDADGWVDRSVADRVSCEPVPADVYAQLSDNGNRTMTTDNINIVLFIICASIHRAIPNTVNPLLNYQLIV